VQLVVSSARGNRVIKHVGTGHDDAELATLTAAAHALMPQPELLLEVVSGVAPVRSSGSVAMVVGSRLGPLWDVLTRAWTALGLEDVARDKVFRHLVFARVLEPTSKKDSLRVLDEAGVASKSYRTVKRRLPTYATKEFRDRMARILAAHADLGPSSLVLFDVSTLHFDTDAGDGFREPGFSKERRLEPQILIGLLTDASGFPIWVEGFPGNRAETTTMIPVVEAFIRAYGVSGVTLVADVGMMSEKNLKAVEDAGWGFIVGGKLPEIPGVISDWLTSHQGATPDDGLILIQPSTTGPTGDLRRWVTYYQYQHGRARRSLRGIDQQVGKAQNAVLGKTPIKRNRFVRLTGGTRTVNRSLETKARTLAGWKPYVTNMVDAEPGFIINAYHQLWHVEHAFRMSKHDLKARPIYHHKHSSIDAHLAIVAAGLAVSTWLEHRTGSTIKHLVKTLRRYRTDTIRIGNHTFQTDPELPEHIQELLTQIR
jgi:hypothetical protein